MSEDWKVELSKEDPTRGWVGDFAVVGLHLEGKCLGETCVVHNPSTHHMSRWPLWLREIGLFERLCPHGIGHPDPDSLAFFQAMMMDEYAVHGCDGCCRPNAGPRYRAPTGVPR